MSAARNKGIDIATGELIVFVDSDDWIEKNTLEIWNDIFMKYNPDMIINTKHKDSSYKKGVLYENKNQILNKINEMIKNEQLNVPWNKVYKAEYIKKYNIRFKEGISIAEDLLFNFEYVKIIKTLYISNEKCYQCECCNINSLTKKYNESKYEQLIYVNEKMMKWAEEQSNEILKQTLKYIRLKNISSCFISLFHKDCKLTKSNKFKYIKKIKKENSKIIIQKIGKKYLIASIIYTYLPYWILYYIYKILSIYKKYKIKMKMKKYKE